MDIHRVANYEALELAKLEKKKERQKKAKAEKKLQRYYEEMYTPVDHQVADDQAI